MPQASAPESSAALTAKPTKSEATGTQQAASASIASPATEHSIEVIGWLFLQKYYGSYTGDKSTLFAFYDAATAAVSHEEFPSETPEIDAQGKAVKIVHVANGKESIQSFFDSRAEQKSKIVVESATFQKSVGESILIVVSGSWRQGSSPLWQFVQTFVLKPTGKTVYDIANDVLKFMDLSAEFFQTQTRVTESKQAASPGPGKEVADKSNEKAPENLLEPDSAVKESKKKEHALESQSFVIDEPLNKSDQNIVTEETTDIAISDNIAVSDVFKPEVPDNTSSAKKDVVEESVIPVAPAQKPTWANLAATGLKTAGKTVAKIVPTQSAVSAAKKTASPGQAIQSSLIGKFSRDEWYPIYIKNVTMEEEELKAEMIKQFGDVKYFKKHNKTALCDFRNKEDQQRALEVREITVKNTTVLLEPRTQKNYNNGGSNGKPDAKKDKKNPKKNGFKKN